MDDKDFPAHSRLFIGGTDCTDEALFREIFEEYGDVQSVHFVKSKETGKPKGIAYVKFSKASDAAFAMEGLNNKKLLNSFKPLVVKVAQDKGEPQFSKDTNEDDRIMRLFIRIPHDETENSIREHFSEFGEIRKIVVLRNKGKGNFAFVKYFKASDTALALENSHSRYGAIFGKLQNSNEGKGEHSNHYERHVDSANYESSYESDKTEILVQTLIPVNPMAISQLFNVIPGFITCKPQPMSNNTMFYVRYTTKKAATYARDKLQNFEYPPTMAIDITLTNDSSNAITTKMDDNLFDMNNYSPFNVSDQQQLMRSMMNSMPNMNREMSNFTSFFNNPIEASTFTDLMCFMKMGAGNQEPSTDGSEKLSFCSVQLPPKQPIAPQDSRTVERLWVMGYPKVPPSSAMMDVFSRFGDLITIIPSNDRNYCYVHYASKTSANAAQMAIDKSVICQMEMKVVLAIPRNRGGQNSNNGYSENSPRRSHQGDRGEFGGNSNKKARKN